MIASLLDGIVIHGVRGDGTDYAELESDMRGVRESVTPGVSPADLLNGTKTALKSLHNYNRKTSATVQAQVFELQQITGMLVQAIVSLSTAGGPSISRLQLIERHLDHAADVQDVRQFRHQLSECLVQIREEKLRQTADSDLAIEQLNAALRTAQTHTAQSLPAQNLATDVEADAAALDLTTGLKTRSAAEAAVADCIDRGRTAYGALFVMDHLHGLNARFGRVVGDQVIMLLTQHLRQKLRLEDLIFRWSGPAFLALLDRDSTLERVRMELVPVTKARLEKTVEAGGRSVLIPLHFSSNLLTISPTDRPASVINRLDEFLASRVGHEL